jgi:hypothetical protein
MAEAIASTLAERVPYRFSAEMMPIRRNTDRAHVDYNTFAPKPALTVILKGTLTLRFDFGDVPTRTFAFLTRRPAQQDFRLNTKCILFGEPFPMQPIAFPLRSLRA